MSATKLTASDIELTRTLGTGAFSKVVVGRNVHTQMHYAVKVVSKRMIMQAPTEEDRQRLANMARREMNVLKLTKHPNIISFIATIQTPEDLLFVTELCDGGELHDVIRRKGRIPVPAARFAAAEIVAALEYLHVGHKEGAGETPCILHRDLKPENIMFSADRHIKLIDFGTAIIVENPSQVTTGEDDGKNSGTSMRGRASTFCGTTHYMSPELLEHNYTCMASDLWALGCVIYHMLSGVKPFNAPNQYLLIQKILNDDISFTEKKAAAGMSPRDTTPVPGLDPNFVFPEDAKDIVQQLLAKDPRERLGVKGGYAAIKAHKFFEGIKWDKLASQDPLPLWRQDAPWVPDAKVASCSGCEKDFSLFRRRHHCRACGNVFCGACTTKECLIPDTSYTTQQRVCDSCYNVFVKSH